MNDALNHNVQMNEFIDELQVNMDKLPQIDIKAYHTFLPGQYIREIIMPAGFIGISKIHATAHPVFACGIMDVYDVVTNETAHVHGYWKGITEPGTRRVFKVIKETILTTVHAVPFLTGAENGLSENEKETLALEIESVLIEKHEINANNIAYNHMEGINI